MKNKSLEEIKKELTDFCGGYLKADLGENLFNKLVENLSSLYLKGIKEGEEKGYGRAKKELMTRQYRMVRKYHAQKRCIICGKELSPRSKWLCEEHLKKNRERWRRKQIALKELSTKDDNT
jgi:predicted nucleic acid-binding Zn ribbon protein